MENKKTPNFFLLVIVTILGMAIYKEFDFQSFRFDKPALAVVYIIVFVVCLVLMIRKYKSK
ncbi:MAG: hypothetical protein AB8B73_13375 [Ekhidna sp.]